MTGRPSTRGRFSAVLWRKRDLAEKLKKHGFKETKASIANKLARATMPAAFFLACLAAMELEGVVLEEI